MWTGKGSKRNKTTHFACCEPTSLLLCAATIYVDDYHPEENIIRKKENFDDSGLFVNKMVIDRMTQLIEITHKAMM